jgi:hypothetical protein
VRFDSRPDQRRDHAPARGFGKPQGGAGNWGRGEAGASRPAGPRRQPR